jgi:hypothetical protein
MQELKRYLVRFVAFVAFLLAAYIQGGGTWRGPHNLRKSLPAKGATIGMQKDRYGCDGCYVSPRLVTLRKHSFTKNQIHSS